MQNSAEKKLFNVPWEQFGLQTSGGNKERNIKRLIQNKSSRRETNTLSFPSFGQFKRTVCLTDFFK